MTSQDDLRAELDRQDAEIASLGAKVALAIQVLQPFAKAGEAMTLAGAVYHIGNPPPIEMLPDGRAAVAYEHFQLARQALAQLKCKFHGGSKA